AALLAAACGRGASGLAVLDPVFAYLSPEAVRAYSGAAREVVVLPDEGASAALYAAIDAAAPETVYLSPLLASEIDSVLSRNATTRVAFLGANRPKDDPRLYAAVFSSSDAAAAAGAIAASESLKHGDAPLVAAVFSGTVDHGAASEAFLSSFRESGGRGEPIIETSPQGYSQAVADRLKALDIWVGYVSAAPPDTERWIRQAFDEYAFVAAEFSLPPEGTDSSASSVVSWDVEETLAAIASRLEEESAGSFPGLWKTAYKGRSDGNK
ncbi:MAG: hypothetical protein KKB59_00285, partial [Spirochaetes bacterium]|nr:hypothetical protein [Spirochaetota bacterium]